MNKKLNVKFPPYLAAVDHKRNRVFVLAIPNLSATRIDGAWQYTSPLPDDEIKHYDLVTDLAEMKRLIAEAKRELSL